MAALYVEAQPVCEPVTLQQVKDYLAVTVDDFDSTIQGLAIAARESCEIFTSRRFINTGLVQCLDSFPYFTDTMMSQMAFPPSYYSLPRYSTTLWNYSQMVKLFYSRAQSASEIRYVDSKTSAWQSLTGTTDMSDSTAGFLLDIASEPPRIFPPAGSFWPPVLYVPNAVQIHYTAGYNNDTAIAAALAAMSPPITPATSAADCTEAEATLRQADVPQRVQTSIMMLTAHWFDHREASEPGNQSELPFHVQFLLASETVLDLAPTRG